MHVPVYCKVEDNCSNNTAHTSSCRGRVTRVSGDVNTHFGNVLDFSVSSDGKNERMDEDECLRKLGEWTSKNDKRWVEHYKKKLIKVRGFNEQAEKDESVHVSVGVKCENETKTRVNGVDINNKSFELISLINNKNWATLISELNKMNDGKDIFQTAIAEGV